MINIFFRKNKMSGSWSFRLAFVLIIAAIFSGFATYAAFTASPPFGDDPDAVIWLLNLDLIILLMLVTLIARRMVALLVTNKRYLPFCV